MSDDKQSSDKQVRDQERRQRERELNEEHERTDEVEPVVAADEELEELLATQDYPTTAMELIDAFGNREIQSRSDSYSLEELLESVGEETDDSPEEAREPLREVLDRQDKGDVSLSTSSVCLGTRPREPFLDTCFSRPWDACSGIRSWS